MSWQNLLVEFLLITAGVNLSCNGKVLDDERQVTAALRSTLFLPRMLFPKFQPPPDHLITTLPEGQSETLAMKSSQGTPQPVNQLTHSMPEAKIIRAQPVRSVNQTAGHPQVKTTVTPANPAHPTGQATIHTVVKTTAAAEKIVIRSEALADQTGRAVKATVATQRATLKPEPPNGQKTTIPALPATTENENVSVATGKHTAPLSQQATTKRANSTVRKNMTLVTAVAPLPTAPVGPTLTPKPSLAVTGAYHVSNGTADCIKALIGLTMIVKNRNTSNLEYFNIDPNTTHTTGICGMQLSTLNISFHGGFIRFTFTKNGQRYYVSMIETSLTVPSEGTLYSGIKTGQLFSSPLGNCFKCFSKQTMDMANNFHLVAVNSQLQAFNIVGNKFGKEEECVLDRNKKLIPVTVGLSLAGLFVIVLVTCMIYRRKPNREYDRI